jgi:hypothetical protein
VFAGINVRYHSESANGAKPLPRGHSNCGPMKYRQNYVAALTLQKSIDAAGPIGIFSSALKLARLARKGHPYCLGDGGGTLGDVAPMIAPRTPPA